MSSRSVMTLQMPRTVTCLCLLLLLVLRVLLPSMITDSSGVVSFVKGSLHYDRIQQAYTIGVRKALAIIDLIFEGMLSGRKRYSK